MENGYKKYDVVMVDFGKESVGSELKNVRPALIIQNNKGNFFSPCTIVVPLSSKKRSLHVPTHTLIEKDDKNGLQVDSIFLGEQIRVISELRIMYKIGYIYKEDVLKDIKKALDANFD